MTLAHIMSRQDNGIFECGGARIRAHCRHLATVVTIRGKIDDDNADGIGEYLRRFLVGENPVVLDLTDVGGFSPVGVRMLDTFDEDCRAAGVEWTLVASRAVVAVLADLGEEAFPVTQSVPEALQNLADAIVSRRALVLPLIRKTA